MTKPQKHADSIREIVRNSTYGYEQVRFLSNNIGPRLSGSPQAAAAVEYIAQQMRELGLDVRLEPVTVRPGCAVKKRLSWSVIQDRLKKQARKFW